MLFQPHKLLNFYYKKNIQLSILKVNATKFYLIFLLYIHVIKYNIVYLNLVTMSFYKNNRVFT